MLIYLELAVERP